MSWQDTALEYSRYGLRVFPVDMRPDPKRNGKRPKRPMPGYAWKERASSKTNAVVDDFMEAENLWGDEVGVAWANGLDGYVTVDLDADKEPAWWNGTRDVAAVNTTARGEHLISPFPEKFNPGSSTKNFPEQGWGEVRGVGGYIVIAGPDRPGFDVTQLEGLAPFPHPEWLTEAGDVSDALNREDIATFLDTHNESLDLKRLAGVQSFLDGWKPGKLRSWDGKAYRASRHETATEIAPWIGREAAAGAYPARDGVRILKEWFDRVKPEQDQTEFMDLIGWGFAQAQSDTVRVAEIRSKLADPKTGKPPTDGGGLNLPDEFWEQQRFLRAVRDAADSGLASRDAVLGSVLTRIACIVPPATKLPAIIGSEATLDFISSVVASSSGGKTISNGIAGRLIKIKGDKYLANQTPGSGEGLIEAFLAKEKDEKGKEVGPKSYKYSDVRGIHLVADEGSGLQEQAGRSGTTIMQTLCSAWSGAQMGQLNASVDTKRIVPGGKRRVALTINIQTKNAPMLFDWVNVGLPQRVLFCWAHGPVPEEESPFPEPFVPESLPMQDYPCELEVAPEIREELRAQRRAVMSGELVLDDLDGHRLLLQLKVAALLALADGRRAVTMIDWGLAKQVVDTSARVRDHVGAVAAEEAMKTAAGIGRRQGVIQVATEEHMEADEKQKIAALAKTLVGKLEDADDKTMSGNQLRKATCSTKTKHRFEPALEMASDTGCIEVSESNGGHSVRWLKAW